ncbi:MAG: flavin-dependent oxidoreductase, methylene-tetrahydromethanopterin reductase [Rhodospirillales bacterium]|nr:flavin-dependent oxidoreductase, methylene-tetrahydromethanopterin reductase [Rhodospirillales bacterium]
MRVFHMTEQSYPDAWDKHEGSLRVSLPNQLCDPKTAADLFHRYYDEWLLADELGLDIMINEHHATATCMCSTAAIPLAILARQTKRARLLVLGYPIANRPDPLRAAEELATIDVISRGRLEMGFVRGVPFEIPVANLNPVTLMNRFWEAHDFILKALTTHDAPFNWEGEFFHYRHVNVWPRPYQEPHPPVWITTSSRSNAREIARRGHSLATMGTGYAAKEVFETYREVTREMGRLEPDIGRFGYLGLLAVGSSEAEARRRGELVAGYVRTQNIVFPPYANPPGFVSVEDSARMMKLGGKRPPRTFTRDGRPISTITGSLQELIDAGIMFCGTPDQVHRQITDFSDAVGGFGNLFAMGQAAWLSHEDTVASMTLFAKEVLPRLQSYRVADSAAA